MKRLPLKKSLGLCFITLFLGACASQSVKKPFQDNQATYQHRADRLAVFEEWSLVGRVSLDDGDQGGGGRLQWDVTTDNSELDFHGALGRGAWHLHIGPDVAVLKEANGHEQVAPDVNTLIRDNLGWQVPLDALHWWVRGLAAPGPHEELELDTDGLLTSLHQFGWRVNFSRYDLASGIELPRKLNATRDNYRVKLAISRWQIGTSHASAR